jgi:hypothetical protein
MFSLLKYILYFIVLNLILNTIFRFNPLVGYIIYFGFIFYWLRGIRFRPRTFRTYPQEPVQPKSKPMGDVIDVEFTEHTESTDSK